MQLCRNKEYYIRKLSDPKYTFFLWTTINSLINRNLKTLLTSCENLK